LRVHEVLAAAAAAAVSGTASVRRLPIALVSPPRSRAFRISDVACLRRANPDSKFFTVVDLARALSAVAEETERNQRFTAGHTRILVDGCHLKPCDHVLSRHIVDSRRREDLASLVNQM